MNPNGIRSLDFTFIIPIYKSVYQIIQIVSREDKKNMEKKND